VTVQGDNCSHFSKELWPTKLAHMDMETSHQGHKLVLMSVNYVWSLPEATSTTVRN